MWKKKDRKCKACQGYFVQLDIRELCNHCAFKIDTADAKACDINGIREDMREAGIPTSGYTRGGGFSSSYYDLDELTEYTIDLDVEDE